jgi:beta-glucosidase
MRKIVEPGAIALWIGRSCAERVTEAQVTLVGEIHEVQLSDPRWSEVEVIPARV